MKRYETDTVTKDDKVGAVTLYCMAAMVVDEASRNGFKELAKSLEEVVSGFLSGMPRDEQRQALRLSYEMAAGADGPAVPRLRLAYSRD